MPGNEEKLEASKQIRKLQDKKYVEKLMKDKESADKRRRQKTEYKRMYRASKKAQERLHSNLPTLPDKQFQNPGVSSYKTSSAKSKAIKKCEESLPKDEHKKREVIGHLVKRHGNIEETQNKIPQKRPRNGFEVTEKMVKEFYESDLVSRVNPGIKDFIKVKNAQGIVQQIQTHSLTMSVKNAHQQFKTLFPNQPIQISKFRELKPKHVISHLKVKHETCLCKYCENLDLLVAVLNRFMTTKHTVKNLMTELCCDPENFDCVANSCDDCNHFMTKFNNFMSPGYENQTTNYYQWGQQEKYVQRTLIRNVKIEKLMQQFEDDFKYYKLHRYVANIQRETLKTLRLGLTDEEVIIIADFSEKFLTKAAREIQAAFFGKHQISIFTVRVHTKTKDYSYIIVSDAEKQSKYEVFAYFQKILELVKENHPNIRHAIIFTDGCAQQFKNRFNFLNMLHSQSDFGVTIEWHFFATSHGKSAADGLGGSIKRNVHHHVISGDNQVYSAKDFVEVALKFVDKMIVFEMTQEEITRRSSFLKTRWEPADRVKKIPGTQSYHFFKCSQNDGFVEASVTSRGDERKEFKLM